MKSIHLIIKLQKQNTHTTTTDIAKTTKPLIAPKKGSTSLGPTTITPKKEGKKKASPKCLKSQ